MMGRRGGADRPEDEDRPAEELRVRSFREPPPADEGDAMGPSTSQQPGDISGSGSSRLHQPWWVRRMNGALELNAAATLLAFVLLDMGSGLFLWGLYTAIELGVDADFALAYATAKALRAPRLALDASAAAALARFYPPLAQVRVCLIVDAAIGFAAAVRAAVGRLLAGCWPLQRPRWDAMHPGPWLCPPPHPRVFDVLPSLHPLRPDLFSFSRQVRHPRITCSCSPGCCDPSFPSPPSRRGGETLPPEMKAAKPPRRSRATAAAREARRLADTYGLALMAAKNFIGPVSIAGIYLALRAGVDVQGWLASLEVYGIHLGGAGKAAGLMAAASWTSTLLFPAVVMGAAELGPVIHRAAQRGLGSLFGSLGGPPPLPPSTDSGTRAV